MIQTFPLRTSYPLTALDKLSHLMKMAFPTIYQPGQGVYDLNQTLDFKMSQATEEEVPWYLADGGSITNVLAAHQPFGAASLAASYDDIAHAATTWDCAPGVAPTFNAATGWYLNGAKHLLVGSGAIASATPLTMICLFKCDDIAGFYAIMGISSTVTADLFRMEAAGVVGGDPVRIITIQSGSAAAAASTSGYTAGSWFVAACVTSAANSRAAYINGGSKGTDTTSKTPGTMNATSIGAIFYGSAAATNNYVGYIAADAWYNVAKSDAQVLAISNALLALVA